MGWKDIDDSYEEPSWFSQREYYLCGPYRGRLVCLTWKESTSPAQEGDSSIPTVRENLSSVAGGFCWTRIVLHDGASPSQSGDRMADKARSPLREGGQGTDRVVEG